MGNNKRYYWLKLQKDFFNNKWVKKLKSLPGGYEYTVIYLEMMLMSIEDNGYIYYEGVEKSFEEEIALTLGEDSDAVRMTIGFLERAKLIIPGSEQNQFTLPEVQENVGSETDGAIRSRRFRERKIQGSSTEIKALQEDFSKDIPIIPPSDHVKTQSEEIQNGFEEFWKAYPRHSDKGMAYKQYAARLKDGWKPEQLLQAAKKYAMQTQKERTEQRYIKLGKTFLGIATPFVDYLEKEKEESDGNADKDPYSEWG